MAAPERVQSKMQIMQPVTPENETRAIPPHPHSVFFERERKRHDSSRSEVIRRQGAGSTLNSGEPSTAVGTVPSRRGGPIGAIRRLKRQAGSGNLVRSPHGVDPLQDAASTFRVRTRTARTPIRPSGSAMTPTAISLSASRAPASPSPTPMTPPTVRSPRRRRKGFTPRPIIALES